jgi:hypothetical protein
MTAIRDSVLDQHARQVMREIADAIGAQAPPLAFAPIRQALAAIWNARGAVDLEAVESRLAALMDWPASGQCRETLRKAIKSGDIRS